MSSDLRTLENATYTDGKDICWNVDGLSEMAMMTFYSVLPCALSIVMANANSYGNGDVVKIRPIGTGDGSGMTVDFLGSTLVLFGGRGMTMSVSSKEYCFKCS